MKSVNEFEIDMFITSNFYYNLKLIVISLLVIFSNKYVLYFIIVFFCHYYFIVRIKYVCQYLFTHREWILLV